MAAHAGAAAAGAVSPAEHRAALDRIERVAWLLDSQFRVPFTRRRFGIDALLGLIPGVGDAAAFTVAAYIVAEASRLGVRPAVLGRMIANIGIDLVIGAVPVLGDAFDFAWKANRRNAALVRRELGEATLEG